MRHVVFCVLLSACGTSTITAGVTGTTGIPGGTGDLLAAHNEARARAAAGLPALAWSDDLEKSALSWAQILASRHCDMQHSNGKYGENLYWSSGASSTRQVVGSWESESACYTYAKFPNVCDTRKGCSACGHYTQLIWRETKNLGCAIATCGDSQLWVCQYDPPGNVIGQLPY